MQCTYPEFDEALSLQQSGSPQRTSMHQAKFLYSNLVGDVKYVCTSDKSTPDTSRSSSMLSQSFAESCASDPNSPSQRKMTSLDVESIMEKQDWGLSLLKHIEFGKKGSLQYRILFRKEGSQCISPWHDIPLFGPGDTLNFLCGTSKGQWIKYEISVNEEFNPLRVKKERGRPSHYAQNVPFHYGFLPQTVSTGEKRSSTALQAFDLSTFHRRKCGDSYLVRPLAAIPVTEEGSPLSWHLITVDSEHPMANLVNSTQELNIYFPGALNSILNWLKIRNCSYADVKKSKVFENVIEFNNKEILDSVVGESHEDWKVQFQNQRPLWKSNFGNLRPLSTTQCEWIWKKYTSGESREVIDPTEAHHEASFRYNKAWEEVMALEGEKSPKEERVDPIEEEIVNKPKKWLGWMSKSSHKKVTNENSTQKTGRKLKGIRRSVTQSFVPLSFRS